MTRMRFGGAVALVFVAGLAAARAAVPASGRQMPGGTPIDEAAAPGANYDKAEFRLWYPDGVARLRGIVVLVPGSNGDGRGEVLDPAWQAFATSHAFALVGCHLTDKRHDQSFIEEYVDVRQGTGQAFLDTLSALARRTGHVELATAPLLLWGMSAGGEFNYEFAAWKPERVIAFVVNKGNIYYTALAPRAARDVPALLFVGGKDLEFRTSTITGLFAVNRRAGALWALTEEPGAAHVVGRSKDMALIFFDDMVTLRLAGTVGTAGPGDPVALKPLADRDGFVGDLKAKSFRAVTDGPAPAGPTAWLPTLRVARAWQAVVTEQPFDAARALRRAPFDRR